MKLLRYEFYEYFEKNQSEVLDEIQKIPGKIGMPNKYKGKRQNRIIRGFGKPAIGAQICL